jgi:hypothetical protein
MMLLLLYAGLPSARKPPPTQRRTFGHAFGHPTPTGHIRKSYGQSRGTATGIRTRDLRVMSPPCSPRAASGHTSPPRRCYRSVARICRHRVVVTSSAARAKTTSEGVVGRFQPDVKALDWTMSSSARLVAAIKGRGMNAARSACTASRWAQARAFGGSWTHRRPRRAPGVRAGDRLVPDR